ncbi:MAG: hypothetical protein KAJ12_03825 [Bacteroidetes bacterium]|nr:hypothetical protein [Bacteroidota bacterium]
MSLGQMMLVVAAMSILGILVLNANRTVLETNDTQNQSEFGINAVSLATSIVEEAMGKMYDEAIADSNTGELGDPKQLTSAVGLGKEGAEAHRDGVNDFNDFDDFHNLFLVYKNPVDSLVTAGADKEIEVPGIRDRYFVRTKVVYVTDADPDVAVAARTWHKKMSVTVTSSTTRDTLVYPALMSYWN